MQNINLGSGPHAIDGWLNFDVEQHRGVTKLDLSRGSLPLPTSSVMYAYSEHFVEHLKRDEALTLFREVHRVLRINGVFRVSTPDLRILLDDYFRDRTDRFKGVWEPRTACQMVNEGMRLWGHQFVYDRPELENLLYLAGFNRVYLAAWHESDHPMLRRLEVRPYNQDLILEAVK